MGCGTSGPMPGPVRRVRQTIEFYDEENPPPPPPPLALSEQLRLDATNILQGLNQIHTPERLVPVVCLSETAYPMFLYNFGLDGNSSETIKLPLICCSRVGPGRVVFVGSLDFLQHSVLTRTETAAFMENLITWSSEYKAQTVRIMLLGFPQAISSTLKNDFASYGYHVDDRKELPEVLKSYTIIFLASNYEGEYAEKLNAYVAAGGALMVFAATTGENSYKVNKVFADFGLAFATCSLQGQTKIASGSTLEVLETYTFKEVCRKYMEQLELEELDLQELDDSVSRLRFYVSELSEHQSDIALDLYNKTWEYLEKIGFESDCGICPEIIHGVFAVILTELMPRLAAADIQKNRLADMFPGKAGEEMEFSAKLRITPRADQWQATGLWLPPGCVCNVFADHPIVMQIGAHQLCMLLKPGPWARWPTVVTRWTIPAHTQVDIASPFGGLLYVIPQNNRICTVSLTHVVKAPSMVLGNDAIWNESSQLSVPWGEVCTNTLILTMPTETMRALDFPKFAATIDKAVQAVYTFIGANITDAKRIVFDIDMPSSEPTVTDVIFMHMNSIEGICNTEEPTTDILELLTYICFSTIPDAFYDRDIELTISKLAACYAISVTWPDYPTLAVLPGNPAKLLYGLWDICTDNGPSPFSVSIQCLMTNQDITTPHDAWSLFVQMLSERVGHDLPQLIDRYSQSGKLSTVSSDRLQAFQLDDSDI